MYAKVLLVAKKFVQRLKTLNSHELRVKSGQPSSSLIHLHIKIHTHARLIQRMAASVSHIIMSVKSWGHTECMLSKHPEGLRPTHRVTAGSWGESKAGGLRVSY